MYRKHAANHCFSAMWFTAVTTMSFAINISQPVGPATVSTTPNYKHLMGSSSEQPWSTSQHPDNSFTRRLSFKGSVKRSRTNANILHKENEPRFGNSSKTTAKQSWLSVASAVAQSAGSDSTQKFPISDESKPTKYHYYPHNQHLYLLPECATQQVCSAVYLRLNYSQPLCACPHSHQPCSVSTRTDDRHTIPLVTGSYTQVLTLVKTCEPTMEVRECRAPKDWSILALQNSRTGKAHYLVICRCPAPGFLEGPVAHSQPAYARVPGIRVYGMTCVRFPNRNGRDVGKDVNSTFDELSSNPTFPWNKLKLLLHRESIY